MCCLNDSFRGSLYIYIRIYVHMSPESLVANPVCLLLACAATRHCELGWDVGKPCWPAACTNLYHGSVFCGSLLILLVCSKMYASRKLCGGSLIKKQTNNRQSHAELTSVAQLKLHMSHSSCLQVVVVDSAVGSFRECKTVATRDISLTLRY